MRDKLISNVSMLEGEAEEAVNIVREEFIVRDWSIEYNRARITCELPGDVGNRFRRTMRNLKEAGYLPSLSEEDGRGVIEVARYRPPKGGASTTHYVLFAATVLTTLAAGSLMFGVNLLENPLSFWRGWPFSASILLILGSHEFGHFFLSTERDVVATPPYFIPAPFILGTLGAVIRMKSPIPDRKSLMDIGAAGPFTGVFFASIVTLVGLHLSPIGLPGGEPVIQLGRPLIYRALTSLVPVGEGGLHPVAFAGWVGFFVTFLNLLPVGQLDGGHIARAVFGEHHHYISTSVPLVLLGMGFYLSLIAGTGGGQIWIIWGLIALFFHRAGHQPPLNDVSELGPKRKALGAAAYLLMLACFTPIPFSVITP